MGNLGKPDTLEQCRRKIFEVIRSEQQETGNTIKNRVKRSHHERKDEVFG